MSDRCLLKRVEEQELEAEKFGFYWENYRQLMDQIQSEAREIQEAWEKGDKTHLQEEVGDLIQAAIGLAVFFRFDPQETLQRSIDKFQDRYDAVVEMAQKEGHATLHHQPYDVLMDYWNRAKIKIKGGEDAERIVNDA